MLLVSVNESLKTKSSRGFICAQFEYANFTSPKYVKQGKGSLTVQLINMRSDFAFGFFSGDVGNVNFKTML
jgi:hypothetical protein